MGCDSVDNLSDFFDDSDFGETNFGSDDIFTLLENLEGHINEVPLIPPPPPTVAEINGFGSSLSPRSNSSSKRQKVTTMTTVCPSLPDDQDGEQRMAHITVERNRRKQMNEHLAVLRSLMPSFYVKRGDQASIIGGVIDYIDELQQILQSLEAKKQRKVIYTEVLSPRLLPSPRPTTVLSPRKPPLSPRLITLPPISPRTPQSTSPYQLKPPPPPSQAAAGANNYPLEPPPPPALVPSPCSSNSSHVVVIDNSVCVNELAASSKSNIADVEVKFSSQNNLLLKTTSPKIPGQAVKIISALENLALEILHVSVTTIDETMLNSFTIKIGIECQLSAEELAQQIQQTFC
ncbi:transcription factor SPEECHLESS-like [Impatiens glandulifera]|uniref:transcription factor SPEECHLESS-like n=1 Tax=Impatiens glandulifera TaxID=253017 RepID=UPI001FB09D78|nr:transcription factor SPEECHLESS-like [Impatiens glandulifera]